MPDMHYDVYSPHPHSYKHARTQCQHHECPQYQPLSEAQIACHPCCSIKNAAGMMAYTVRRRTVEEVKKLMAAAESPADAVTRVFNTMHGRKAGDENGDDDLLVSNTVISLKDPLSGTRIQYAARLLPDTPCWFRLCASSCCLGTYTCLHVAQSLVLLLHQATLSAASASRLADV